MIPLRDESYFQERKLTINGAAYLDRQEIQHIRANPPGFEILMDKNVDSERAIQVCLCTNINPVYTPFTQRFTAKKHDFTSVSD
jgi:hypothetical protein